MKKPKQMKITLEELDILKERIENHSLMEEDYEKLDVILETIVYLQEALQSKKVSISKLLKMIFGVKTEKSKKILNKMRDVVDASKKNKPAKGHGPWS
jgi:hypothetical protein